MLTFDDSTDADGSFEIASILGTVKPGGSSVIDQVGERSTDLFPR